jgi:hypothetical protein
VSLTERPEASFWIARGTERECETNLILNRRR